MGLEPVPELAKAMDLKPNEVCRLDKSAYGLIDAPFLWFQTLCDELKNLGFTSCPFDPCVFILRNPKDQTVAGVLGIHVDDGIHGGDQNILSGPKSHVNSPSQESTYNKIQTTVSNCHSQTM